MAAPPPKTSTASNLQHTKVVDELQTKVQFLEKKRAEDRDRLKKMPELEEKATRYETVIQKLQAKCQSLHTENNSFKKADMELKDAFEKLERAQAEHDSILELATLDREMAEETVESLRAESAALKSKMEELSLENEILLAENAEFSQDMSPQEKASQGWLHLQRENERLKDALFRLRDWSQEQEEVLKEEIKALEDDTRELGTLKGEHEDNKSKLDELGSENELLREQLEAALASETLIEQLTERNLAQSEQLEELHKTVEDLRELKELSDELELNHMEHEKQLQEVIDFNEALVAEATRKFMREREDVMDREYTIVKFRELVSSLQGDLEQLRQGKEVTERDAASLENSSRRILDLNRQLQASASQGSVKLVDMELRKLEADQALDQLAITKLLAPDAFQSTEQGSIMAYLRFKRIGLKAGLLRSFVKQRVEDQNVGSNVFVKCEALDKLVWMLSMADRFVACIESCSLPQFAKFAQTFQEMEPVERHLNGFIDGLKRNDLQESQVVEGLTKSMAVMRHVGEVYLGNSLDALADEVLMRAQLVQTLLHNTAIMLAITKDEIHRAAVHPSENGEVADEDNLMLFERNADSALSSSRSARVVAGKLLQVLKDMKSRSLSLDPDLIPKLDRLKDTTTAVYDQFRTAGLAVHSFLVHRQEAVDAPEVSFEEILAVLQHSSLDAESSDIFYRTQSHLRTTLSLLSDLTEAAADFGQLVEFERAQPPWVLKSHELAGRKVVSAAAEDEIRSLKRDLQERATLLKVRQQEMEEIKMKVDLLDKRNKEAANKLERMNEMEKLVEKTSVRERDLERGLEELRSRVQKAEDERDSWMKKAAEGLPTKIDKSGEQRSVGDVMVNSAEMERLRSEIKQLQKANRYLRTQIKEQRKDELRDDTSWLSMPLRSRRHVSNTDSTVEDAKAVLKNIALLPLGVKPLRLDIGRKAQDQKPKTMTPKYQLIVEEMRKLKAWEPVRIAGVDLPIMAD
jgi:dynactin 1